MKPENKSILSFGVISIVKFNDFPVHLHLQNLRAGNVLISFVRAKFFIAYRGTLTILFFVPAFVTHQ